jgi:hypothetical protein
MRRELPIEFSAEMLDLCPRCVHYATARAADGWVSFALWERISCVRAFVGGRGVRKGCDE